MNPIKELLLLYVKAGFKLARYYRSAKDFIDELLQFSQSLEAKKNEKHHASVSGGRARRPSAASNSENQAKRAERRAARLGKMMKNSDSHQLLLAGAGGTDSPTESPSHNTTQGTAASHAAGSIDVLNGDDMAKLEAELLEICAETPLSLPGKFSGKNTVSPLPSPRPAMVKRTPVTLAKKSEGQHHQARPLFAYLEKDSDSTTSVAASASAPTTLVGDFSSELTHLPQYSRGGGAATSCSSPVRDVSTQKKSVLMARSTNQQTQSAMVTNGNLKGASTETENIAVALIERFGQ